MGERVRILLVEDDKVDRMAFERFVERENLPYDYEIAGSVSEARNVLTTERFDAALMDYFLGDGTALDLFGDAGDTPIVVITGSGDEEIAVKAMKAGVTDYLIKDPEGSYLKIMPVTVEHAIRRKRTEEELGQYREHLEELVAERTAELTRANEQLLTKIADRERVEEALAYERDLLHVLMDNVPDPIYFKDADSRFTRINKAQAQVMGVNDPQEVIGKTDFDFFAAELARDTCADEQEIMESGQLLIDKVEKIGRADGQFRWVSVTKSPIMDKEGRVTGIVGISRDITGRKRAEEALRASKADLEHSLRDLAERVVELEALHSIGVAMSSELETEVLLQFIVEQAAMLVDATSCSVLLPDEETGELVFRAAVDHVVGKRVPAGQGIAGRALRERAPQIVHDVTADPEHYTTIEQEMGVLTRSLLAVPLLLGDSAIGVLTAINKQQGRFTEGDRDLLVTMASHAAIAIENARLYEQAQQEIAERRRAEEVLGQYTERLRTLHAIDGAILAAWSSEEIAQVALRHIRRLVPCLGAGIVMFDFEAQEAALLAGHVNGVVGLEMGTRLPLEGIADVEALRQGKVLVEEDTLAFPAAGSGHRSQPPPVMQALQAADVRSYVTVPLIAHGELVGILALGAESPRAFAPEHVDIAHEIASQIAVALRQAQLHEQVQRHVAELERRVAERTADLSAANAELARAARLKDEFLASMSHELRTPLNAVLGLSEALQEQVYGPLNERQLRSLYSIEESGRHLLALINDILDVSKIEAGKVELEIGPVSVETVCQASLGLIKQAAHKKRLKVSSSFGSAVTTIQADQRRLKQILVNLLGNAVKFTPEGGAMGLEVVGDAEEQVVHFTVWDTGIGISPAEMGRLFKPFVQLDSSLSRRHAGTGLGLVLVHRMTEMHGGGVSVESELGKGSRFTISLPWKAVGESRGVGVWEKGESTSLPILVPPSSHRSTTVLLAEDNEDSIHTICDYLLAQGYRVVVAWNGAEALERAREERPDVILMDIQMPEVDGLEATRHIRADADLGDIPIIALTALAMPGDRERCLEVGVNEYLSKPVSLKRLVEVIEAQLGATAKV